MQSSSWPTPDFTCAPLMQHNRYVPICSVSHWRKPTATKLMVCCIGALIVLIDGCLWFVRQLHMHTSLAISATTYSAQRYTPSRCVVPGLPITSEHYEQLEHSVLGTIRGFVPAPFNLLHSDALQSVASSDNCRVGATTKKATTTSRWSRGFHF